MGCLMASCMIIPITYLIVTLKLDAAKNAPVDLIGNTIVDTSAPEVETSVSEEISATEETASQEGIITTVDPSYFDDALFIGDSRTVGLKEYGTLTSATFFADTGLSIYEACDKTLKVDGIGSITLADLLSSHTYGKIYLMLGINELGYSQDQTAAKYAGLVDQIRKL